jgi:hypothetical protein
MCVCPSGDGNNSLAQGFVGPAALAGRLGYHFCHGRVILIGHQGCGALVQEGPPLVFLVSVLSVCAWCWSSIFATPASPIFALSFKNWCHGDESWYLLVSVARR